MSWQTISCVRFRSSSESRGPAGSQQKNACHQISRAVGRHTSCRHRNQLLRVSVHPVRKTYSENHKANAAFVTRTSRDYTIALSNPSTQMRGFLWIVRISIRSKSSESWFESERGCRDQKLAFTRFRPGSRLSSGCGTLVASPSRLCRPPTETLSESHNARLSLYSSDYCWFYSDISNRMR